MSRRYLVFAPGHFADDAKTAHGVIRYGSDEIAAVVDPEYDGKTVRDVLPHLPCDAPIVANVDSGLAYGPTALLVGVAPQGGGLPPPWRAEILRAIDARLEIVSGLHDLLAEDVEFSEAAERRNVRLWDVRESPDVPLFSGAAYDVEPPVLLTVGSDCAVGKMTVSLELVRAAHDSGMRANFVPTGQTGILIAGWGIAVDRVIADFAPGAVEQLVLRAARDTNLVVVEGQGSINHPAYAPVTMALLYGAAPDGLVLVVDPARATIGNFKTPRLGYQELIAAYEGVCGLVKPAAVLGIALTTRGLSERAARAEIARAQHETSLPADDVVRYGPHALFEAIRPRIRKKAANRSGGYGMKRFTATMLALVCIVSFAACTRVGTQSTGNGGRNSWTIPGTLRIGIPDEPDNINPMFAHTAETDEVDQLVFAYLFRYDDKGDFYPDLATEMPSYQNGGISKDGRTLTVHMRKGTKWADGAPLTAKDWLFTYHAVMNNANNTKSRFGWDDIASVQLPDDYTIRVTLKSANADILGLFASGGTAYPPLPEHTLGKLPDLNHAAFNSSPLSSGPWILQKWNHGSSLEFVPNKNYWRGPPKLRRLTLRVLPNGDTQLAQLQTHEIDVYPGVNEDQIDRIKAIPGVTAQQMLVANWRHVNINTSRPLLHDVRVRLAIAEAVNWDRILNTIYHGVNIRATSDVYPKSWAAPNIPPYKYDPADAKRLLARAGFTPGADGILRKNGTPLHITINATTATHANEQTEVQIQQDLKAVGIDLAIKNYPTSMMFAQTGPLYTGNYDIEWSISTNGADPDNEAEWSGKFIPPKGANTTWLDDPLINKYAHEAILTYDRAARKALYQKEEERMHALVPSIFVYWENQYNAWNSDLKNYKPAPFIANNWNSWEWEI